MKNKRTFIKILSIFLVIWQANSIFAQEENTEVIMDIDEFDSLFENAADDIEVEETAPVFDTIKTSGGNLYRGFKIYGTLKSNVGVAAYKKEDDIKPTGYFDFDNDLKMKAWAGTAIVLNGSVKTTSSSLSSAYVPDIYLNYLYFDYLMFDRVFLSAGVKTSTFGDYVRLLENPVLEDTAGQINIEVKYPWSTGTLMFLGAFDKTKKEPGIDDITFGLSVEQVFGHTSVNVFGKKYGKNILVPVANTKNKLHKNPIAGVEVKRTIFGFDVYGQSIVSVASYKKLTEKSGYESVTSVAGLYRLWDAGDPNFGFNLEYKNILYGNYLRNYDLAYSSAHIVGTEIGLKRMGKNKNLKLGLDWTHNFTEKKGNGKLAFLVSDLFPYANWSNGIEVEYEKGKINPKIASLISIKLDY